MAFDVVIKNRHRFRTLHGSFASSQFQTKRVVAEIYANLAASQQLNDNTEDMGV